MVFYKALNCRAFKNSENKLFERVVAVIELFVLGEMDAKAKL
jgi:hypothetical protein